MTLFLVAELFMGVTSIRKYALHTFQRQIVKNGHISTDNESDDKVVYLQKMATCDHVKEAKKREPKNPRKGVPILAPFPSSGHSWPLIFFMTFGHDV